MAVTLSSVFVNSCACFAGPDTITITNEGYLREDAGKADMAIDVNDAAHGITWNDEDFIL